MKRITLFSTLTESNSATILEQIFPEEMHNKVFAYMPSDGIENVQKYIEEWKVYAQKHGAKFNVIDNTTNSEEEKKKLLDSNTLVVSGGNTFNLLHNLRKSGLDRSIIEFTKKPEFVIAGFSAGAIVLTPSIKICNLPVFSENTIGLDELTGLSVVDFEVFPHYKEHSMKNALEDYRKTTTNIVKEITDEDYISMNL